MKQGRREGEGSKEGCPQREVKEGM